MLLSGLGLAFSLACGGSSSSSVAAPAETPANPNGWNGSKVLEAGLTLNSQNPSVAIDSTGAGFAVWQKVTGSTIASDALWGAPFTGASSGWQPDQALSTMAGSQDIKVAGDGTGNYLCAWDSTADGSTFAVQVAPLTPAGVLAATPVSPSTGNAYQPTLALNASGAACVAWTVAGASHQQVWASLYNPATALWSAAQQVSSTTSTTDDILPLVAMDGAGNAVLLWVEGSETNVGPFTVQMATCLSGGAWSAPYSPTATGAQVDTNCSLALTDAGALAVWAESADAGSTWAIRSTSWTAADGFPAAATTVSATGGVAVMPTVARDASGNALAVWTTGGSATYAPTGLAYASFTPAGGWLAPQPLVSGTNGVEEPVLGLSATGAGILAFNQWDGFSWRIGAANFTPASGWAAPVYIQTDTAGGDAGSPNLAVNASGQGLVVWYQTDAGSLTHVYGNRYN